MSPSKPEAAPAQADPVLAAIHDLASRLERIETRTAEHELRTPRVRSAPQEAREQSAREARAAREKGYGPNETRSGAGSYPTDNQQRPVAQKPLYREHQLVAIRRDVSREGMGVLECTTTLVSPEGVTLTERVEEVDKADQAKRKPTTQVLEDGRELRKRYDVRPLTWGEVLERLPGGGDMRCGAKSDGFECGAKVQIGDVCPTCGTGPQIIDGRRKFTRFGGWKYKVRVPGLVKVDGFYEAELEAV